MNGITITSTTLPAVAGPRCRSAGYVSVIHKMKKFLLLITVFTVCSGFLYAADKQTTEFRHFVREFFKSEEFQINSVKFPLEKVYFEGNEINGKLVTKYIRREEWKHFPGPNYYRCQKGCYDLVIYDNFEKKNKKTNKRVLSLEGISNGIHSSLYFELINGAWYLVKYEELDN